MHQLARDIIEMSHNKCDYKKIVNFYNDKTGKILPCTQKQSQYLIWWAEGVVASFAGKYA